MKPLKNKYSNWYFSLTETRKDRVTDEYTETHHIIPRSLGGDNCNENLVRLTPREHFIAHWLLSKMFEGDAKMRMGFAFHMMFVISPDHKERYRPTSRVHDTARKLLAESFSAVNKGRVAWNRGKPRTIEERALMSMKRKEGNQRKKDNGQPTCWNKGIKRTDGEKQKISDSWSKLKETDWISPNKGREKKKIYCVHCSRNIRGETNYIRWHGDNCRQNPAAPNQKRVTNFTTNNPGKIKISCPYCQKLIGGKANYNRWHGGNCKARDIK